jgi:hypothetical protein
MAGQLPSFLNGSNVQIKIGEVVVAFCQNLNFTKSMQNVAITSIGSYSTQAQEPTMFFCSGSMTITRYSSKSLNGGEGGFNRTSGNNKRTLPDQLKQAPAQDSSGLRDGNSLVDAVSFNPRKILISSTFDIDVYERGVDGATGNHSNAGNFLKYTLKDCRLTGYGLSFAVGSILQESVSFICRTVVEGGSSNDIENSFLNTVTPIKSVY